MPTQGCGDEGKSACAPTQQEVNQNAAKLVLLQAEAEDRECKAGNEIYCPTVEKHPAEVAGFVVAGLVGAAALPEAWAITEAFGWNVATACATSIICWTVTGAGGAEAAQEIPLLQPGGSNNPRTGPIISRVTTYSSIFYRYWSTDLGNEAGSWVTTLSTRSSAVAEDMLSMPYTPDAVSRVTIPAGFRIQESLASPLFGNSGLGHQVELLGPAEDAIYEFLGLLHH